MKPPPHSPDEPARTASAWVMRLDRGLSPAEQDRYLQWLAADPRHADELARQRRAWEKFDRIAGLHATLPAPPDPDLLARPPAWLAPARRGSRWRRLAPLAAAAALALGAVGWWRSGAVPNGSASGPALALNLAPLEERALPDGSTLQLNRGAAADVAFSASERRVTLDRGEAAFDVAKDAARPFVVVTRGVAVRAVGTAFNVRLGEAHVEVIVTEGRVAVASDTGAPVTVDAGQRAVVPLAAAPAPPDVITLPPDELARRLAWQPRLLTFTDEPLAAIVAEFNRHNPVTLRADDPALRDLRLTARFRSDNLEGFLRLLAADFGVQAEPAPRGAVVLRPGGR